MTDREVGFLARPRCVRCKGTGMRPTSVCDCVYRTMFTECWQVFQNALAPPQSRVWGRGEAYALPAEEFCADLTLIARRTLDPEEHRLFRFYFLLGAPWKMCAEKLGLNRGEFWRRVYQIEAKLGFAFRNTQPHGLHPPHQYFKECRALKAS